MNASHSFCTLVDTNYLVPTEVDQIIIIEATSLQGVREWSEGQKFRTISKLSDYSSYLWIEKK